MSKTVTIDLVDEIVQIAEAEASRTGSTIEQVMQTWLVQGMADRMVGTQIVANIGLADPAVLPPRQQVELAALLRQQAEGLSDAEQVMLDELLRLYRKSLVSSAQAITDWLAADLGEAPVQITQLLTVSSQMLYAVGYDGITQTLEVVFNSGGIYRYFHVPPQVYQGLLSAESKGRYMWTHLFNLYPYARLRRG